MSDYLLARQKQATEEFIEHFARQDLLYDLGPHLTCTECNVLRELLAAFGEDDAANALLEGHALCDDEGDNEEHYALKLKLEKEMEE